MTAWSTAGTSDFRGPLDISRAATVLLDGEDRVIGWNAAAEELFGYAPPQILGRPLGSWLVDLPAPEREAPEPRPPAGAAGPELRGEARLARCSDGRELRIATSTCAVTGPSGVPMRLLVAAELEPLRSWESHQAMLHGLATQSPIGLGIYDTDLRLTWSNARYQEEISGPGARRAGYEGRRVEELYADGAVLSEGWPPTLSEVMQSVLERGEPALGVLYQARPPFDPDLEHVWSCSYYPLRDSGGRVMGVCEDAIDITDRYRAQQRLALTVRAGVRIGTTLDMTTTAEEIAEVVVPAFADAVLVDLAEGVLEGAEPGPETMHRPSLVRVVQRPAPGGRPGPGGGGGPYPVRYPPDSPQYAALAAGEAVAFEAPEREAAAPECPDAHAALAVPLRARGTVMGQVTFLRAGNPAPFDAGEITLANELATRAAVSIDNARRFTRERSAALTLQRNLLPRRLPELSAVETAHRYLPADVGLGVGGDWYDVIALSGSRVGLAVGDVVGHGVHAAATMGRLRTAARALARLDLAPDELLSLLDDVVLQGAEELGFGEGGEEPGEGPELEETVGVTCLYLVYDPVTGGCTAARAGHPPPALIGPDGEFSLLDVPAGPPLGVGGLPFETHETALPAGSLLALFTNGLVENRTREMDTGLARLARVLTGRDDDRDDGGGGAAGGAPDSLEELCDRTVDALHPRGPATEDAALLLARTRVLDSGQVAAWQLAAEPGSVARARALIGEQLPAWGLEPLVFTTELVVSELVTNALRHASAPIALRLIRDRTLQCEVSDASHTTPNLRLAANDDEGGRGLFIVAQLVQRWGTRYTAEGKSIWTEQPLP